MTGTETNNAVVVRPQGRITAVNVDAFRRELQGLIDSGKYHLVIDLADVDLIDSKGLAVFIMCHQSVASRSGSLTVLTSNQDLQGLFRVMRLDRHFTVRSA